MVSVKWKHSEEKDKSYSGNIVKIEQFCNYVHYEDARNRVEKMVYVVSYEVKL
jgi:hypothetical protein